MAPAGAFVGPDGKTLPVPEGLPNAHMRLFGGAQYHRAMAEFRNGIGQLTWPDISREEIVNACGIDDFHDGVNYTRTACVIAVSKARDVFEPFLHQVWPRLCSPAQAVSQSGHGASVYTIVTSHVYSTIAVSDDVSWSLIFLPHVLLSHGCSLPCMPAWLQLSLSVCPPPTFPLPTGPFLHCCLSNGVAFEPSLDSRATC